MQLTVQDLWENSAAVADFLYLDNWWEREELLAFTTTTTLLCWGFPVIKQSIILT